MSSIQRDLLMKKLRDPKLMEDIITWAERTRSRAYPYFTGEVKDELEDLEDDWISAIDHVGEYGRLQDGFFSGLVDTLPQPAAVTAEELDQLLFQYLGFVEAPGNPHLDDFGKVYEHFLFHVEHHLVSLRISREIPLSCVQLNSSSSDEIFDALGGEIETTMWSSDDLAIKIGKSTSVVEEEVLHHITPNSTLKVYIALEGIVSDAVFTSMMHDSNISALRSVIRTAAAAMEGVLPEPSVFQTIGSAGFIRSIGFIRSCISTCFIPVGKGDSFDRRITNANRLLAAADLQLNDAVGLALCVAALEALLAGESGEITAKLSERIAVLMEPDTSRRACARDYVKKLYDDRSKVLHGKTMAGESNRRRAARILAAGVLFAVWYRMDFIRRMDQPVDKPNDLKELLRCGAWDSGLPEYVPDLPEVRRLWEADVCD